MENLVIGKSYLLWKKKRSPRRWNDDFMKCPWHTLWCKYDGLGQKQGTGSGSASVDRGGDGREVAQPALWRRTQGRRCIVQSHKQDCTWLCEEDTDQRNQLSTDGEHSEVT